MVKIYVVDNGGQWTHREWRTLRDLDVETKIVPNTISFDELQQEEVDGLVLSGGAPRIGLESTLGNCDEYLKKASFPILGICAGHQYMARFFGGDAQPSKIPEFGKIELHLLRDNEELFQHVPQKSIVWESHNDEVTKLPKDFVHLAESEYCKIQAMRHTKKPFFGLQFHPEVEHTEYGEQIFQNFVALCKQY
ncbi:MAG: GMP synthase subunit A [Candidatus Thermoplasmatota archaeon]